MSDPDAVALQWVATVLACNEVTVMRGLREGALHGSCKQVTARWCCAQGNRAKRHLSRLKLRPCRSPPTRVCILGRCRGARDASRPQLVPCGHRRPGPPRSGSRSAVGAARLLPAGGTEAAGIRSLNPCPNGPGPGD